jgi:DNA-binding NarL/FixJ family response regulator
VITLVLADDHEVIRQALRTLLEAESDLLVVGETADGLAVLELVQRLRPTVLLLDLKLPGLSGLEITRQVHRSVPGTRIVILSMFEQVQYVHDALRHGATGYVGKGAGAADLLRAVRTAAAGERYLSPPLTEAALAAYADLMGDADLDRYDTLTTREREVFHLAAEGCTSAEIAARLSIGVRTAESHRANLMRKLELHGQSDLVRFAVERGFLPVTR